MQHVPVNLQNSDQHNTDAEISRLLSRVRQLEEEIRLREKREGLILHAKREWERTADTLPDLLFIVDLENKYLRMNRSMLNHLGMTFNEALGSQCTFCCNGDTAEICLNRQSPRNQQKQTFELHKPLHGGYFEVTLLPLYDAEGNHSGTIHIARDINDQKKTQLEREKLHARLLHVQKLESVFQLAAGMAHEINTPIQFINSNIDFIDQSFKESSPVIDNLLELLESVTNGTSTEDQITANVTAAKHLEWDYLSEEIPEAIKQSKQGLKRVTALVQAMKNFSQPGGGEKVDADLNHLIETTITITRNQWDHIAIDTDLDPHLQSVPCMVDDIGQVLHSLIVNGAQAIEDKLGDNPEGERGRITISTRQHNHHVEIRIGDTGKGIPEDIQSKVFDPFFTTKDVGKGTGQGLAIAHDVIVDKHDGTLIFETKPGSGTVFIIRLPRR